MKIKNSRADVVFLSVIYFIILVILIITLYPLLYALSASFSDPMAIVDGSISVYPVGFNLTSYKVVLTNPDIVSGYLNAILYTVLGTLINLD